MIQLKNEKLCVCIAERGAEIVSVKNAAGYEYIWQADPAFWAKHCPVLFPVCGRLRNFEYTYREKWYKMGNHGFAQRKIFAATHEGDSALFVLREDEETLAEYPFRFELRIRYTLEGNTLHADVCVFNPDEEPLYCNFGSHEAYAAEHFSEWSVRFEKEENLVLSVQEGGYLTGEKQAYAQNVRTLPLSHTMFENDSLLFDGLASRRITLLHGEKEVVSVDFAPFEHLLLWTKPGAPYLCIEPWNGIPDYADADGDLTHKAGILHIGGGQSRQMRHSITFHD